jgi:septal ring factor EnvC (AmiA/AmiB activator)
MTARVEELAKRLALERCQGLVDELGAVRAQLLQTEQELRAANVAQNLARGGGQQQAQIKALVEAETAHLKAHYADQLDHTKQLLEAERRDHHTLKTELDRIAFDVRRVRDGLDGARARELDGLWDRLRSIESSVSRETVAALSRLAPTSRRVDPNQGFTAASPTGNSNQSIRIMQLESAIDTLKRQQDTARHEMQAQVDERDAKIRDLESELSRLDQSGTAVRRQLHTQEKDRAALKKILEQRVKVKLDSIAQALRGGIDSRRVDGELQSLQNLINASIAAMNAEQQ